MTKRKTFGTRAIAFLSALFFAMTLVLLFPVGTFRAAADEIYVNAVDANMTINGTISLNGQILEEGDEVKNGDILSLNVTWSLPDFTVIEDRVFVYDLTDKLHGITLTDTTISVEKATYIVTGNMLYIKVLTDYNQELNGYCGLSGTVNVSSLDENNQYNLQFMDTVVPVYVTDLIPKLSVYKSAGTVTYDGGNYYQEFTVTVKSENQPASNVTVTDIGESGLDFSQIQNLTVKYGDGQDVECTPSTTDTGFSVVLPEVGTDWSSEVKITYSVPVDIDGILDGTAGKDNTVSVSADKLNTVTATASATASKPSIRKSGTYNDGVITWTITVNTGSYKLLDPEFTVTDIPGLNLDSADIAAELGGDLVLDKSEFTSNGNGTYTYTYSTTPEAANQLTDTTYTNSASATFTGITGAPAYTSNEASVTVYKTYTDFVDKTYGTMDSDRNLTWYIKVEMPDEAATAVTVDDYFASEDNVTMSYDIFKVNGTYTLAENETAYNTSKKSTDIGYFIWEGRRFTIIDSSFLNNIAANNEDITISYDVTVPSGTLKLTNYASVTITVDGQYFTDDDAEIYTCDVAQKYLTTTQYFPDASNYEFPVVWGIRILTSEALKVGDVITVVDTLPEGFEYISCRVGAWGDEGYSNIPQDCITASVSGNKVTFVLTVTQELLDEDATSTWDTCPARIVYLTQADSNHADIYLNGATTYTNNASVKVNDTDIGEVSCDVTLEPKDTSVVTKDCVTTPASGYESAYATYTIKINPNEDNLSPGNTLTATDTLGSRLTLDENSMSITPPAPYEINGQVITFTLDDETYYEITYKATFTAISTQDNYTQEEEIAMFGNSITIGDSGSTSFSTNTIVGEYKVYGGASSEEALASITISGTKTWSDALNESARPKEITIKLVAHYTYVNSTTEDKELTYKVDTSTVDGNGNWTYTIENLTTLTTSGTTITYDVEEVTVDGYKTEYSVSDDLRKDITNASTGTVNYPITITNTFTAADTEKGNLKVTKEWIGDSASVRPEIKIVLTDDSADTADIEITLDGDSVTFENLQLYNYSRDSETDALVRTPRKYKLSEVVVNAADQSKLGGYELTKSYDGEWFTLVDNDEVRDPLGDDVEQTLTNTYTGKASVSVEKVWDDNDNQDGIRPENVTVKLLADDDDTGITAVLNEGNSWKYTFTNLDKFKDGTEIEYSVDEVAVTDYTSAITGDMASGFVVTNTHAPAETQIAVEKLWDDNDNQDGIRPENVTVKLLADDDDTGITAVLNEDNSWKYTFTNLDKFKDGTEIEYSVDEVAVTDYTSAIKGDMASGFVVTNTHTPETTKIAVKKVWDDDNNRDNVRPASVKIKLLADGADTGISILLNDDNKWKHTFTGLDKFKDSKEIDYTVSEDAVTEYTTAITGDMASGFTVTNTHEFATTSITGTKIWDDDNDAAGKRPDSIKITLYGNGVAVAEKEVTANDGWEYTFDNLLMYEDGEPIKYWVAENTIDEYTPTYSGYNITNTYDPGKTFINVTKVWDDDDNRDNIRPVEITVNLCANGNVIATHTLNASNNWTYFAGLDKYDSSGNEIQYTVDEVDVPDGYSSVISGSMAAGFVVTNTHSPAETQVAVEKVWDDNDNQDGIRPTEITVKLLADGYDAEISAVLNDANGWKYTFTGLDKKNGGTDIKYTIEEVDVPDEYTSAISGSAAEGFTVTNTLSPAITSVSGKKIWKDNDNEAEKRPDSITVKLLADGKVVRTAEVKASDDWKYTFENLPVNSKGKAIIYTVDEVAVDGYTTSINGYNITNTYGEDNSTPSTDEKVSVQVTKKWVDDNNSAGLRPDELEITLYQNGVSYITLKPEWIKNGNTWTYTFDNLPKYIPGTTTEYAYTISEENLSRLNYTGTMVHSEYEFILTNTRPKPVTIIRPDPKPIPPEDVSSESSVNAESDMLDINNTTSYSLIVILLAVTAGGIVIAKRRQK